MNHTEKGIPQNYVRASIVTYNTETDELSKCIESLRPHIPHITIIDNSPNDSLRAFCIKNNLKYIYPGKNLGYGTAHNIALRESLDSTETCYHLVINSDVRFDPEIIPKIVIHLEENPEIGQLIPKTFYPDGRLQPVVRLLPSPLDVFGKRFFPKNLMAKRLRRFLLEFWNHDTEANIPYHQGSFMFLRLDALRKTGLFDERFFMYPEDIDLTRRIHRNYKTIFWPEVSIIHDHRASSYKSWKMLRIHLVNMFRYFCKWGWIFDYERKQFNKQTLRELNF